MTQHRIRIISRADSKRHPAGARLYSCVNVPEHQGKQLWDINQLHMITWFDVPVTCCHNIHWRLNASLPLVASSQACPIVAGLASDDPARNPISVIFVVEDIAKL